MTSDDAATAANWRTVLISSIAIPTSIITTFTIMRLMDFTLNSMTLLGAEMVGRAYGGGMLKLEPKEADLLPVPSPALTKAAETALRRLRPQLVRLLASGQVVSAARMVDEVLLIGELGLPEAEVKALRQGHEELTARRVARGGAPHVHRSDGDTVSRRANSNKLRRP